MYWMDVALIVLSWRNRKIYLKPFIVFVNSFILVFIEKTFMLLRRNLPARK